MAILLNECNQICLQVEIERVRRVDKKHTHDQILKEVYPYVKDKIVLDVGCVEHDFDKRNKERIWVHDFLREYCQEVVGIDYLEKDVQKLQHLGYNVFCMNAENFCLKRKFDVVFAGELIEHLSNPGLFLDCCKRHLKPEGRLILTTPNAFCINRAFGILYSRSNDPPVNLEHTCWYSPQTLTSLLNRYGFEVHKPIRPVDFLQHHQLCKL